jgi:signal transduction histidine kinase
MLHEFITAHREEIIKRTQKKIALRTAPLLADEGPESAVPLFLDQLVHVLQSEAPHALASNPQLDQSAAMHGREMLRRGLTVAQLVHDYGAVCQSITQLMTERGTAINSEDYRHMNGTLDDAIAAAVTGYSQQREQSLSDQEVGRLGFLAHELRNLLSTAILAYQAVRSGRVGIVGSTGDLLGRSLKSLNTLVDRSLSEVRLASRIEKRQRVRAAELIEEAEASATIEAVDRGLQLRVAPVDYELVVEVDRQLVEAAVANLLQNAFKFTRAQGQVSLRAHASEGRVLIEVEDECGGLPPGKAEELFLPFEQRGADRSGLGLGLAISLQSVKANGGRISVRNLPGKGCIFTIELPLAAQLLPAS